MDEGTAALTGMRCVACRKGEPTLTDAEISAVHAQIPDWEVVEVDGVKRLRRVFSFATSRRRWASPTGSVPSRRKRVITRRC